MTTSATTVSSPSGSTALASAMKRALASALCISTIFMFTDLTLRDQLASTFVTSVNLVAAVAFAVLATSCRESTS